MGTPLFIYFYLMTTFLGRRSQSRRTRSAGRRSRPNSTGSTSTTTTTTLSQCHHVDCGSRCRHQQTTAAPRRKRANNDSIQRSGTQILADSLRLHDVLKENDRLQRELNAERDFREHLVSVVEHREQQWQLLKLHNQNNETKNIIKSNELNSEINEIPLNNHENDDAS